MSRGFLVPVGSFSLRVDLSDRSVVNDYLVFRAYSDLFPIQRSFWLRRLTSQTLHFLRGLLSYSVAEIPRRRVSLGMHFTPVS